MWVIAPALSLSFLPGENSPFRAPVPYAEFPCKHRTLVDRCTALGPGTKPVEKGHALDELVLGYELIGRMRLRDVAGSDDDRGRACFLEQTGLGRVGDRVRLVVAGKAERERDRLGVCPCSERRYLVGDGNVDPRLRR